MHLDHRSLSQKLLSFGPTGVSTLQRHLRILSYVGGVVGGGVVGGGVVGGGVVGGVVVGGVVVGGGDASLATPVKLSMFKLVNAGFIVSRISTEEIRSARP